MYSYIRKNQKQLMAFFGVILMIAFIIPTGINRMQGDPAQRMGHIGDTKVTRNQVLGAEDQWNFLARTVQVRRMLPDNTREWLPIVGILPPVAEQMNQTPEVYYLLLEEARRMGLSPNVEEARQFLNNPDVAIRTSDGRRVEWASFNDENVKGRVLHALPNLLMVAAAFDRATRAVKISEPLSRLELAVQFQQIKVQVVDFSAREFEDKVPAPTPEQLQKHFDAYGDQEAGSFSEKNPFGFGYRYPNRVKLHYIGVPREQVNKAVRASKTGYEWDVQAHKYYNSHLDEYKAAPPPPPATTQSAFSLDVNPPTTAATAPTTRPFAEVRDQVITAIVEPMVDRLQRQIVTELTTKLNADYEAYRTAKATTAPGATTTRTSYDSFEYLQALARDVEARHKVTFTVASIADSFKDAKELRALPGVGQVPSFPDFVTTAAEAFVPADQKDQPGVLSPFEPSRPIQDESRNTYVFRIAAADPSHKPATIDEVKDQVVFDWKRAQAFGMAKAEAAKVLEAARSDGLSAAAGRMNLKLITTGEFSKLPSVPIENYSLSTRAQTSFVQQTYSLLGQLNKPQAGQKPVTLVEMPADGKVAVAELIAVDSTLTPDRMEMLSSFFSEQMMREYQQLLARDWFKLDSVAERLGYVDETGRVREQVPTTPQAALPPL